MRLTERVNSRGEKGSLCNHAPVKAGRDSGDSDMLDSSLAGTGVNTTAGGTRLTAQRRRTRTNSQLPIPND